MDSGYFIGLDLGGTKIAGAVLDTEGHILARHQVRTPVRDGGDAIMSSLLGVARVLLASHPGAAALGVGSAGQIDRFTGTVIFANENLPGWTGMPIRKTLESVLRVPVAVDNDVHAMALGEAALGAGRGRHVVLVVAIGTGIGGAVVTGGGLQYGAHGLAGEIGHIPLSLDGPRCACGNRGCLEAYASGPHIAAAYAQEVVGRHGIELPEVAARARSGDVVASTCFHHAGRRLGQALIGLVNTLNPDVVVIGGGVLATWDLMERAVVSGMRRKSLSVAGQRAAVVLAALGSDAGVTGAALLAQQMLNRP